MATIAPREYFFTFIALRLENCGDSKSRPRHRINDGDGKKLSRFRNNEALVLQAHREVCVGEAAPERTLVDQDADGGQIK